MISVILPAYNEEDSIGDVIDKTVKALNEITNSWEIVVVDDGSKDLTFAINALNYLTAEKVT